MHGFPFGGRGFALSIALTCLVAITACPSSKPSDAPDIESPGDQPATSLGGFDEDAFRTALDGGWSVRRPDGREVWRFVVSAGAVRATDLRFSTPVTREGSLVLRSATGFGLKDDAGVTYYYSFVRTGSGIRMGLGHAIRMEPLPEGEGPPTEWFRARLGAFETLERRGDSEKCIYRRTWNGSVNEKKVPCGFAVKSKGKRTFFYESEDPYRPGAMKRNEWVVVDNYLFGRDLSDAIATKVPLEAVAGEGEAVDEVAPDDPDPEAPIAPDAGPTFL